MDKKNNLVNQNNNTDFINSSSNNINTTSINNTDTSVNTTTSDNTEIINNTTNSKNINSSSNKANNNSNLNNSQTKNNKNNSEEILGKSVDESMVAKLSAGLNDVVNSIKNNTPNESSIEKLLGKENYLSENYALVAGLVIVFIFIMILYFMSKTFNVYSTISRLKIIKNYVNIEGFPYNTSGNIKLKNCYVLSSYNSALNSNQMLTYVDSVLVKEILQCGARYIELNIFNDKYGDSASPIISNGYRVGEWKLTLNNVDFEEIIIVLKENAFKILDGQGSGVNNPDDPLFLALNLNTNNNIYCLNKMFDIIVKHFIDYLLGPKFNYQQSNLANVTLNELKRKLVIISSDGFQGSKLEEIINYSWEMEHIKRLHGSYSQSNEYNRNDLIEYNRDNLSIIYPNNEGDYFSYNYDPLDYFLSGCQFVSMNFHLIDNNLDDLITRFRNKAILAKPVGLRGE